MSNNSTSWFVSQSNKDAFSFYTEGIVLTAVSLFGLVGNAMSIPVLVRAKQCRSFSNLLKGLACFDALFLLAAILVFGLPKLSAWYDRQILVHFISVGFGLIHTFRVGSVFVTTAVSVERFCAIVHPLKHFGCKRHLLGFSVVFAILYNVPKYFEMRVEWLDERNRTTVLTTDLRRNAVYASLYVVWSKLVITEIVPYMTILVCNAFIGYKIAKSAKFRKQFEPNTTDNDEDESPPPAAAAALGKQKEEHNLGVILICMSALFVFCQSFKLIPDLYELIWCNEENGDCEMPVPVEMCIRVSHLLVCVNSSANFLLYYFNGRKFRKAWVETYGSGGGVWCRGNQGENAVLRGSPQEGGGGDGGQMELLPPEVKRSSSSNN